MLSTQSHIYSYTLLHVNLSSNVELCLDSVIIVPRVLFKTNGVHYCIMCALCALCTNA